MSLCGSSVMSLSHDRDVLPRATGVGVADVGEPGWLVDAFVGHWTNRRTGSGSQGPIFAAGSSASDDGDVIFSIQTHSSSHTDITGCGRTEQQVRLVSER